MPAAPLYLFESKKKAAAALPAMGGGRPQRGYFVTQRGLVTWAEGHLLRTKLPPEINAEWRSWSPDLLPLLPDDLELVPDDAPHKRQQLAVIRSLLRNASEVVIATDPAREGEGIGREILDYCGYRGPLRRLLPRNFHTPDLRRALADMDADPRSADRRYPYYLEFKARRELDWLIGMNASRALTARKPKELGKEVLQSGSVKTPLVAMVLEREREIRAFIPETFHPLSLEADVGGQAVTLEYGRDPDQRIKDRETAEALVRALSGFAGKIAVDSGTERVPPPRFLDLASLQAQAGRAFGWSPSKTLKALQALYVQGHVTYPRTESNRLPISFAGAARDILGGIANLPELKAPLAEIVSGRSAPEIRKGMRYVLGQQKGEHHAIIPTSKPAHHLRGDARSLYLTVARNYAANHLKDAVDRTVTVSLDVTGALPPALRGRLPKGPVVFAARGRHELERGWRAAGGGEKHHAALPQLDAGAGAKAKSVALETSQTRPPERYRQSDLPRVMARLIDIVPAQLKKALATDNPDEPKGLGTAATRDTIIKEAIEDGYLQLRDGKNPEVEPTPKAEIKIDLVHRSYMPLADPVSRAQSESLHGRIGEAGDSASARRIAEEVRGIAREEMATLTRAILSQPRAEISAAALAERAAGPPTKAMLDYAIALAERHGSALDPATLTTRTAAASFIRDHVSRKQPPSPKVIQIIDDHAQRLGIQLQDGWRTDAALVREPLKQIFTSFDRERVERGLPPYSPARPRDAGQRSGQRRNPRRGGLEI